MDSYRLVDYRSSVFNDQQTASGPETAVSASQLPGLWPSILAALLFGALSWFSFGSGTVHVATEGVTGKRLELAQVDDQDVPAALNTMGGSRAFQAQFKQRLVGCPRPLAWVSLSRDRPGEATAVRLRSGNYVSPNLSLMDTPVRIAIPYPAPYELGHGTLSVIATGGDAVVSLLPVWRVAADTGMISHEVTWRPRTRCAR